MPVDWTNRITHGFDPPAPNKSFLVIRGKPGTGKSCLAAGAPGAIHIDLDPLGSNSSIVGARAERMVKKICTFDDYEKLQTDLIQDAKESGDKRRFSTVIWDNAGQLLLLCRERVAKNLGVDEITGFDHGKVSSFMRNLWLGLSNAGYGMIVLDHDISRVISDGKNERIITETLLPQGVMKYLDQDCHHTFTTKLESME